MADFCVGGADSSEVNDRTSVNVVVEGCCHGELDKIYEGVAVLERERHLTVDLLLCCGDFQAVRNLTDLECLACPQKYRRLNQFHEHRPHLRITQHARKSSNFIDPELSLLQLSISAKHILR